MSRRHPPPGRPQANPVIERKIGVALAGIIAYLVTGCLPNCFWPFAGHCFSFNQCLKSGAYTKIFADNVDRTFVTGQLVFFYPAPTIQVQAKTDAPLRPGVFLDYYCAENGKFTGQYVVADLEDFTFKNLHHRIGRGHFKLRLHRTEVVREPANCDFPVFPLLKMYY